MKNVSSKCTLFIFWGTRTGDEGCSGLWGAGWVGVQRPWRTLALEDPGPGGPWRALEGPGPGGPWRALALEGPGPGGPWPWRALALEGPGGPWPWRALEGPGPGGPWSWRALVLEGPGPGGPWPWRALALEDPGPGGPWPLIQKINNKNCRKHLHSTVSRVIMEPTEAWLSVPAPPRSAIGGERVRLTCAGSVKRRHRRPC
jgi:hypothetical protein